MMQNQTIPQLAAALCTLGFWALCYALGIVGRSERSLTRRLLRYAHRHPWRTTASLLLLAQIVAFGGGKTTPPITGVVTSIWHRVELALRHPDTGEFVIIPGSYKEMRTITETRAPDPDDETYYEQRTIYQMRDGDNNEETP